MQQLIHTVHAAHQIMRAAIIEATGLTPSQVLLLLALEAHGGASQTQLVEVSGIDRSTLADMVRRMLRSGHLTRRRTREDARAYAVRLTPLGEETVRQYRKAERALSAALHQRVGGLNGLTIIEVPSAPAAEPATRKSSQRVPGDRRAAA